MRPRSTSSMRAMVVHAYGGPEALRLEDVAVPEPKHDEVLVRLQAAGVNPVDTYLRSGAQGYAPRVPFTPGMDGAGEVEAIGPGVDDLQPGERVYVTRSLTGTYSELALCRPDHVFPLPEGVSHAEGACLGVPYGTAMRAFADVARVRYGDFVLVHGASGGVGTAAVQIAAALGARVAGTAGTDDGRQLVLDQGADAAFDHHRDNHLDEAVEWTGGRGFDVILAMAAERTLGHLLPALARGGTVVVIGSRGEVAITPRDLMKREARIVGMSLLNATSSEIDRLHRRIRIGLQRGELRPVVRQTFPLPEAAAAHELVMASGARGNVVLEVT